MFSRHFSAAFHLWTRFPRLYDAWISDLFTKIYQHTDIRRYAHTSVCTNICLYRHMEQHQRCTWHGNRYLHCASISASEQKSRWAGRREQATQPRRNILHVLSPSAPHQRRNHVRQKRLRKGDAAPAPATICRPSATIKDRNALATRRQRALRTWRAERTCPELIERQGLLDETARDRLGEECRQMHGTKMGAYAGQIHAARQRGVLNIA